MFDLQHYLDNNIQLINTALDQRLPAETKRPAVLHKAMRYSVFAGGKRLRPLLCLAAADASGRADTSGLANATALTTALAIEILHTYTLIHDDLPSMDDDTLRRSQPTLHIVAARPMPSWPATHC